MMTTPNVRCTDCGWQRYEVCADCAHETAGTHRRLGHTVTVTAADPRNDITLTRLIAAAATRWAPHR